MRRLKILLLNTQMEMGGAQKAMLTLAQGLQARGHIVSVVTMYDKGEYATLYGQEYGLEIINLDMKRPGESSPPVKAIRACKGLFQLYSVLRRNQFDIIQTFTHYSNLIGPVLATLARTPVRVSSQRNTLRLVSPWLLWLDRVVQNSPLVHKMTTVSENTRQFCIQHEGIRTEKLVTIYSGIDLDIYGSPSQETKSRILEEINATEQDPVIATVARLHPQKGHHYLLEATVGLRARIPGLRVLFVGEGPLHDSICEQISEYQLQDTVYLLGGRQDIPDILGISTLFVLPSLWEGLPNGILEAMGAGVPVIATDVGGCTELVSDRVTGRLVPPANSQVLADTIVELLQYADLRNTYAEQARKQVEVCFSVEKNINAYHELYHNLLNL